MREGWDRKKEGRIRQETRPSWVLSYEPEYSLVVDSTGPFALNREYGWTWHQPKEPSARRGGHLPPMFKDSCGAYKRAFRKPWCSRLLHGDGSARVYWGFRRSRCQGYDHPCARGAAQQSRSDFRRNDRTGIANIQQHETDHYLPGASSDLRID